MRQKTTHFPFLSNLPQTNPSLPSSFLIWKNILSSNNPPPNEFQLTFIPTQEEVIAFDFDDTKIKSDEWSLSLVGYSMGQGLYYKAILATIHKVWNLKGSMQMLFLSDGFFLFKFSSPENFEMVWLHGVRFLLSKPFVLQKWSLKFRPKREEFMSVPHCPFGSKYTIFPLHVGTKKVSPTLRA
ncbi:hypothetical protein M5K25_003265 [Dendrobium thyrsiflorum]|uniref:DUF4283 domain-containing protein n=1 Tax=Dendrobium thyrsiflorum TaxID=117978 RepID=A0ABD0VQE6_DENTH